MRIKTRQLVISALLLAADVVLTRVLAVNTLIMKIGFGFAAVAVCAMLYSPGWTALIAALGDLVGSLLFPTGAYFPGFTLTAAVTGAIFGFCLHSRRIGWRLAALTALLNCAAVSFFLNSLLIAYISGAPVKALLAARGVQLLVMTPLQCLVLRALGASKTIEKLKNES